MQIREFASGLLGVLAVTAAWSPSPADACTCDPSPIFKVYADPQDGAMNVPLNKALVFEGAFRPGSVTVEDGLGQRVEDLTINEGTNSGCLGTWAEIIPKQPWGPRMTYIVRVQAAHSSEATAESSSLRFVAGVESLPESDLTVPKARASLLVDLPEGGGICGPIAAKTCLNVEGQTEESRDVEVIARRGDKVLLRTLMPINDADYGFTEVPDCLELRRRSPTGKRSKPVMLCGDDLPATKFQQQGNKFEWPSCQNGKFPPVQTAATGGKDADPPKPSKGPPDEPGTGSDAAGSPPSTAGHTAGAGAGDEDAKSSHREYGCAAAPGKPANLGAAWLVLATLAVRAVKRRREPQKQPRVRAPRA